MKEESEKYKPKKRENLRREKRQTFRELYTETVEKDEVVKRLNI